MFGSQKVLTKEKKCLIKWFSYVGLCYKKFQRK